MGPAATSGVPRPAAARLRAGFGPAHPAVGAGHGSGTSPATWAALAAILAVAAFLRLWDLQALGANSDEAVYAGQAASIAGDAAFTPLFPIFRAHPLLFQTLLSVPWRLGGGLETARMVAALLGVGTVYVTFRLGRVLYGTSAGLAAALLLAVMPYHVVVSRQVLLDGPMTLCATLALYLLARFAATARPTWLYAAAAAMGLTVLCKETSILLLGAVYAFFALAPEVPVRIRQGLLAAAILIVTIAPFPAVLHVAGGSRTGGHYLAWQLFRRPNHDLAFYPSVVPPAVGVLVLVLAAGGLWLLRRWRSWRETLLVAWIVVPVAFFVLWPVKGFQYLLPCAPAAAVLAARTLALAPAHLAGRPVGGRARMLAVGIPVVLVAVLLAASTWGRIEPSASASLLAGSGGMPGGREAGRWIGTHVPPGAQVVTIGPSMANVIAFYGHRRAWGLSVSPNPLSRNPSYQPLVNPDLAIREARVQYAVWDAFSASRTSFFARSLQRYVERYRGRVVHAVMLPSRTASGRTVRRPAILVYVLRP